MASGTHVASKGVWTSYGGSRPYLTSARVRDWASPGCFGPTAPPRPLSCGLWPPC